MLIKRIGFRRCILIGLFSVMCITGVLPAPANAQAALPRFEQERCWFGAPSSGQAECGYVIVPEDRANPGGPTIRLAVAVFKSASRSVEPDPIIFLQGGPGGGAIADFGPYLGPIWSLAMGRDVIFLDQRGTGLSEPSLLCNELTDLIYSTLDKQFSPQESAEMELKASLACRDRLLSQGVNLPAYTNRANAADVNDVRAALGYDTWNLYGVSYGTELALTVMRDFPDTVRSAVLDSVVPLQADLMADGPVTMRRVLDQLFTGCAADAACQRAYPDLERVTFQLIADLDKSPVELTLSNSARGERYNTLITGDVLFDTIFISFYITPFIPRLPAMIYTARDGDYRLLREIASETTFAFEDISYALYYSVTCENEFPFSSPDRAKIASMVTPPELRERETVNAEALFNLCAVWGMEPAPAAESQAVTSAIPTLVLSGEYDPVTPPTYGEIAARTLENSHVFTFPGLGHGVLLDGCASGMIIDFVIDPSKSPDASCINRMPGPEWVISR